MHVSDTLPVVALGVCHTFFMVVLSLLVPSRRTNLRLTLLILPSIEYAYTARAHLVLRRMLLHMRCGIFEAALHSSVIEGIRLWVRGLLLLLQGSLRSTRCLVLWRDAVCNALQQRSIHGICHGAVAIGRG